MKKISKNPLDYGMRRFTDLEISFHTIMIENLPKDIPRIELQEKLHEAFQKTFNFKKRKQGLNSIQVFEDQE